MSTRRETTGKFRSIKGSIYVPFLMVKGYGFLLLVLVPSNIRLLTSNSNRINTTYLPHFG